MTTQQIPQIEGRARDLLGSRPAKRERDGGRLPAVIYGHKEPPVHISLDLKTVTDLLHHRAHVFEVKIDSKTEPCLIKDIQWNHLGSQIVHIDLARVDLTERVTVEVELAFIGEPVGLKESGTFLQRPMDQLEIECLASQIPEQIKVDISNLGVGDSLTIVDLNLPEGFVTKEDSETIIASV